MEIVEAFRVEGNGGLGQQVDRVAICNHIRRRLAALAPHSKSRFAEPDWRKALRKVIEDLEDLNRSTEQDFLAVGEKLMEFRSAARDISSGMAALSELISSQAGEAACRALSGVLEHTRETDSRLVETGAALESVRDLSSRVRRSFAGLPNTVMVFRSLCTLTRIETARLGGAGADFGNLAEEVQPLSERIQCSGEGVLEAAGVLDEGVRSALASGAELRATELRDMHEISASVMRDLQCFQERRERARETSFQQAAQYSAACRAIDDLVQSVQFHDITRQQVEHVTQALHALEDEAHGGAAPRESSAVLALQASQLSSAAQVFASSVERIESDLAGIATRAAEMAEASRALMGISGDDQNAFFLEMERSFTNILKAGRGCSGTDAKIGATAARLKETIGRMRASVDGIHGTEIQIQRIAINATIRATQLEAAGDALGVVAEVMQRLAIESNRNTETVAEVLDSMLHATGRIAGTEASTSGAAGVFDQMQASILELHSSSERSFIRVNEIEARGARLAQNIGALRSGLTAGRLFAQVTSHALEELQRLGAAAGRQLSQAGNTPPNVQLADLAGQYTMQRERDVHRAVAEGAALPADPADAPQATVAAGNFGENVELF